MTHSPEEIRARLGEMKDIVAHYDSIPPSEVTDAILGHQGLRGLMNKISRLVTTLEAALNEIERLRSPRAIKDLSHTIEFKDGQDD